MMFPSLYRSIVQNTYIFPYLLCCTILIQFIYWCNHSTVSDIYIYFGIFVTIIALHLYNTQQQKNGICVPMIIKKNFNFKLGSPHDILSQTIETLILKINAYFVNYC
jgi:hypothetical protein